MLNNKYIDLHTHSNSSDGMFFPKQLVGIAKSNNVRILSITDHDSIGALNEFRTSIYDDMIGIKGIEFSSYVICDNEKVKIHILGYCFDENNSKFKSLVKEMNDKRRKSHLKVLCDLRDKFTNIPEEEIYKLDINRYCWFDREIIKCFENANYSAEKIDELKNYYKINRFQYDEDYALDARRVVDIIHSAGGYVIFAHPMAYKFSNDKEKVQKIINKLVNMGIDGIEIYQSDCSISDTIWLKEYVDKYNLLYSVGSDFHRTMNSDGRTIGLGIDNNLCITETTLTNEIIKKRKYFKRGE